jgi:anthranilate phosphoribosyltransferase
MLMKQVLEKILGGNDLTADEAAAALDVIMTGQATDSQIAGLLIALRSKGESVDELVGFARTMRLHAVRVMLDNADAIDMCGTGGDGRGTFNISTVAAFVAAGAGATVAKHGNRSVSSRCGSADVLAALGVNIQMPSDRVEACINEVGIGFLFAPMFHPAMKHAAKPRVELGVRTIFNMLGPLTNPAGVRRQLIGTFSRDVAERLACALQRLSAVKACVVHSDDGLDEISVASPTTIFETSGEDAATERVVDATTFGLSPGTRNAVAGGSAEENAAIALAILRGEKVPGRDVVIANAAAGIYVAGRSDGLGVAAEAAREAIESGRAMESLKRLVDWTTRG